MSSPLAPSRSIRPAPRVTPEERRAREHEMMRQFGNLEMRADMDPYLADDPLARLGFDPDRVDWLSPRGEMTAFYAPSGANLAGRVSRETLSRYSGMYPDRGGSVPPDTIVTNAGRGNASVAHESRHRGLQMLRDLGVPDPDYDDYSAYDRPVRPNEETLVEAGDLPFLDETYNVPRDTAAFERGDRTPRAFADTIEASRIDDTGLQRYFRAYQELAQEELTRRGEPPRAVMQTPGAGQYVLPRTRTRAGGLLGLLDLIRGD